MQAAKLLIPILTLMKTLGSNHIDKEMVSELWLRLTVRTEQGQFKVLLTPVCDS